MDSIHSHFLTLRIIDVRLSFQSTPIKFDLLCVGEGRDDNDGGQNIPTTIAINVIGYRHVFYMLADPIIDAEFIAVPSRAWRQFFYEQNVIKDGRGDIDVSFTQKMSLFHFSTELKPMWKFTTNIRDIRKIITCLEETFNDRQFYNVFLDDTSLSTHMLLNNFITVRIKEKSTTSTHYTVHIDDLIKISPNEEEAIDTSLFPYRVLSIDIECLSHADGSFPKATSPECEIICIGCSVYDCGSASKKCIFATCNGGGGNSSLDVRYAPNESKMLLDFIAFIEEQRPNILIGYNVKDFDLGYIYDRMHFHHLLSKTAQSTMDNRAWSSKKSLYQSNQMGSRECRNFNIFGFIIIDIFEFVLNNYKLDSYKLNAVAKKFIGKEKLDMPYENISVYYRSTDLEKRNQLLEYCVIDADLCVELFEKLNVFNCVEAMAIVCGIPIRYVLERGQQVRTNTLINRELVVRGSENFVFPLMNIGRFLRPDNEEEQLTTQQYKGAHVIDPKPNFYRQPICTLDFASLYPSIMIAFNMCYSTLLPAENGPFSEDTDDDHTRYIENNVRIEAENCVLGHLTKNIKNLKAFVPPYMNGENAFVSAEHRLGILPSILQRLLSSRKQVRNRIAQLDDSSKHTRDLLNSLQLAFKMSANSIYGATGANNTSKLPCVAIASSVTAFGRFLLSCISVATEKHQYSLNQISNHRKSVVVYGDTDSIMIKPGGDISTVPLALEYGMYMAKKCSQMINASPLLLEFEKVYCPYLLLRKKNYVGLMWTESNNFKKIDSKGIKTARRDTIPLTKKLLDKVINFLMMSPATIGDNAMENGILDIMLEQLEPLVRAYNNPKITADLIEDLVISKKYTKETYAGKQPHVEVVRRVSKSTTIQPFKVGDRIPFVILNTKKTATKKLFEKAFCPAEYFANPNNFSIDFAYYSQMGFLSPLLSLPLYNVEEKNAVWFQKIARALQKKFPKINFEKLLPTCVKNILSRKNQPRITSYFSGGCMGFP